MEPGGAKNSYTPSATTSTPSTTPKLSPLLRPRHFISREDGTLTALIAVDELPPAVRIAGVPRVLQPSQLEGMKSCGVEPHRHQHYIIEAAKGESPNGPGNPDTIYQAGDSNKNVAPPKGYQAPNPETSTIHGGSVVQGGQRLQGVESWRRDVKDVDTTQATIDAITAANTVKTIERTPYGFATPNAVTPGTFGKKIYCTHWIRRGECDYTQQGCLYKHEMPDEATLDAIGIKGYPRWYIEANPNLFPVTGLSGRAMESENPWRAQTARLAITAPTSPFVGPVHSSGDIRVQNYRQQTAAFSGSQAPFPRFGGHLHGTSHRFALPQAVSSLLPTANTSLRTSPNISPRSSDFVHSMSLQASGHQPQATIGIAGPHASEMKSSLGFTARSSLTSPAPQTPHEAQQFRSNTNSMVFSHTKPEPAGPALRSEFPKRSGTAQPEVSTSVRQTRDEASAAPGHSTTPRPLSGGPFSLSHPTFIPAASSKPNALGRFVPPDYQHVQGSSGTSAPLSSKSGITDEKPASFTRFSNLQTNEAPASQPAMPQETSSDTNGSTTKPPTSTADHSNIPSINQIPEASINEKSTSPDQVNTHDKTISAPQAPLPYYLPSYSVLVPSPASASKPRTSSPLQQNEFAAPTTTPKNLVIGMPITSPPHHRRLFVAAGDERPVFVSKKVGKAPEKIEKKETGVSDSNGEDKNGAGNKKTNTSPGKKSNGGHKNTTSPKTSNGHRSKEPKNGNGADDKDGSSGEGKGDKLIEI